MSYRSFKRVLGETNLERKCLILFAACLFLLITGAFWYAEQNAERLVTDKARKAGQGWVIISLLKEHLVAHHAGGANSQYSQQSLEMMMDMNQDLSSDNPEWEILVPEGSKTIEHVFHRTRTPTGENEKRIIADIRRRFEEQIDNLPKQGASEGFDVKPIPDVGEGVEVDAEGILKAINEDLLESSDEQAGQKLERVSFLDTQSSEYHYYEAVYWTERCIVCHVGLGGQFLPKTEESRPELRGPFRVVKVTLPNDEAQLATIKSRSILLATAIITVFLAVITLYLVVRYVVVKPLNHLRYVSDEISRGNTSLRADIQTNDEFEELAASFNRMLRHLIDVQEELQKVNVDLDGKVDQLAQANMQLHEMNRLKSDFLATMSHELRTPLNSIIGFSDVLKGLEALNDKQQRYVDNIGSSGRVLLEMINDILDLAKMESGKMELRPSEFALAPVVYAQSDLVRSLTEEKNIDLDVQIAEDFPPLYQDQAKVQQILTNLLSNAIKFTPEGGRIVVTAVRDPQHDLVISVEDTGVGIAEEDRGIIFEKFRQGATMMDGGHLTRKFSGTGLGLSIVKELCRLLGGEISFESELGKGSTFRVQLPWRHHDKPNLQSSLSARLDEMTKPQRMDSLRAGGASSETNMADRSAAHAAAEQETDV